MVFFR